MSLKICLILWIGCSGCAVATEMIAPTANFVMGLYDADTYITKDCAWFSPVKFTPETKAWYTQADPPAYVLDDLKQVAFNNDMALELCK